MQYDDVGRRRLVHSAALIVAVRLTDNRQSEAAEQLCEAQRRRKWVDKDKRVSTSRSVRQIEL